MDQNKNYFQHTFREKFLVSLLNKIITEYKTLMEIIKKTKPLKIIEIKNLSTIPGETQFIIQVTNRNCFVTHTAAEIISHGYSLSEFNEFHAEMIRQAAQGKLIEFLNISNKNKSYKIISKIIDRESKQYIFTIETKEGNKFIRTSEELSKDKNLLANMDFQDIYDIGYTKGYEYILEEKASLLLIKNSNY